MATKHYDVTLGATATQISSTRQPIKFALIHNTANNNAIYIGDKNVTASSYGHTLASSEECTIGPFSGEAPFNTNDTYIFGTADEVVHVLVITH